MANDRVTRNDVEFPFTTVGGKDRVTRVDVEFPFTTVGGKDRVTRVDVEFPYVPVRIDQVTRIDVEFPYIPVHLVTNLRFDASGNLWACRYGAGVGDVVMLKAADLGGSGVIAPTRRLNNAVLSGGSGPTGVTFDALGNIYVSVSGVGVYKFASSANGGDAPIAFIADSSADGIS